MGFWKFLQNLLQPAGPKRRKPNLTPPAGGLTMTELAPRLGLSEDRLNTVEIRYETFQIPKRFGGKRTICAPSPELKEIQRAILHRLLKRLKSHPAATGFESTQSIVTNALLHVGAEVVLRMDIKDFFPSTEADRVRAYFYTIGWGKEAADVLIRLCTWNGSLPQGAPTSPRLSNLVNTELDSRLDGWARRHGVVYTRYADDMTFSIRNLSEALPQGIGERELINQAIHLTRKVLSEYGYQLHMKKKLNIRRRHQQQKVTGLVVNERVSLPRTTRRRLRAMRRHLATGRPATLTAEQMAGWEALESMIQKQKNLSTEA